MTSYPTDKNLKLEFKVSVQGEKPQFCYPSISWAEWARQTASCEGHRHETT